MLASEWRELEALCNRISSLRHRFTAAQRSKNTGLVDGLQLQIAHVKGQRERLVQHISARLGAAVVERQLRSRAASERPELEDWMIEDPIPAVTATVPVLPDRA